MGRLDILVLNAGALEELAPLSKYNDAAWDEVVTVSLTSNAFVRLAPPTNRFSGSLI